jgi:chromate transporter
MEHQDTKIGKLRRWQFLKNVFWLGCTAFGGPQMHLPLFKKRLVDEKRFVDKETLLDINAFCSILPGPSTTQTITALGFKLGGPRLAFLSLLAWVLPGAIIMTILTLSPSFLAQGHLYFLEPMVAAFLLFAVFSMLQMIRRDKINYLVFLLSGLAGYLIQNPLIFPLGVILGAVISSNFGNRKFTPNTEPFGKIRWANFSLYIIIFLLIGSTGLLLAANENTLGISKPIILFENTYRMGSLSFGGGNMLSAMAMEHFVQYKQQLSMHEFNTGLGIVQGLPGPNFNFAIYLNGIALRNAEFGLNGQLLGCLIGLVGIFLPGTLLVFFVFPLWKRLQTYPIVQRSLDGIFSASVGFILSAALIIHHHFWQTVATSRSGPAVTVFIISLILLLSKKVPPPLIVLGTVIAGFIYTSLAL